MLSGDKVDKSARQDEVPISRRAENWTDRYADEGDESDFRSLIHLAGEILEFVVRRRPDGTSNPAAIAMEKFIASLIEAASKDTGCDLSEAMELLEGRSWKEALDDFEIQDLINFPRLVEAFTALYAYGDSGIAWGKDQDQAAAVLKEEFGEADELPPLLERAAQAGSCLVQIRERARGRWALDHGEPLTPEQIALLGSVDLKTVRNAVSAKEMLVDDGMVPADSALAYLMRKRRFNPSEWLLFGVEKMVDLSTADAVPEPADHVFIPMDRHGRPFLPDLVRVSRELGILAYKIGPKGEERYVADYYDALDALIKMPKPAWRRPNDAGNWGISQDLGGWERVRRDVIDQMIERQRAGAR